MISILLAQKLLCCSPEEVPLKHNHHNQAPHPSLTYYVNSSPHVKAAPHNDMHGRHATTTQNSHTVVCAKRENKIEKESNAPLSSCIISSRAPHSP